MLQLGRIAGLAHEAVFVFAGRELTATGHFHSHEALQLLITSPIDGTEPTAPHHTDQLELSELGQLEWREGLRRFRIEME